MYDYNKQINDQRWQGCNVAQFFQFWVVHYSGDS